MDLREIFGFWLDLAEDLVVLTKRCAESPCRRVMVNKGMGMGDLGDFRNLGFLRVKVFLGQKGLWNFWDFDFWDLPRVCGFQLCGVIYVKS